MLTLWPSLARVRGSALATSASPPVLAQGALSYAANTICILSYFFFSTKPLVYKSTRRVTRMQMKRKPKFGQNFLVVDAARYAIVDALGDISKRTVIEIGPGHGAITEIPAGRCRRLIALELDGALAAELSFRFRDQPQVQIIEGDVLKADLRTLVPDGETADVIGNLPYYITSDILLQLLAAGSAELIDSAVLIMQHEVADHVTAAPGIRDYGLRIATAQMNAQRVNN